MNTYINIYTNKIINYMDYLSCLSPNCILTVYRCMKCEMRSADTNGQSPNPPKFSEMAADSHPRPIDRCAPNFIEKYFILVSCYLIKIDSQALQGMNMAQLPALTTYCACAKY